MRTRIFWPCVIVAIAILVVPAIVRIRKSANVVGKSHPSSSPPPAVVRRVAAPFDERLLEEKRIERLAAKVIEQLTANTGEVSSPTTPAALDRTAEELAAYRKQVQALSKHTKELAVYIKEIERALSIIDTRLSTPSVLKEKLEQQRNRLRP
jgi:hypothetical protein